MVSAVKAYVPVTGRLDSMVAGVRANFKAVSSEITGLQGAVKTVTTTPYTVLATDTALILNPTAAMVLTLPTPTAAMNGRSLRLKLIAAHAVTSSIANVVPLSGAAASTAILAGTVGKYSLLQCDGTNWQIMAAN